MLLDYNMMLPKLTSVTPNDRRAGSQCAAVRCHSVRRARKKPAITIVGQMVAGQTRVFHQQPSGGANLLGLSLWRKHLEPWALFPECLFGSDKETIVESRKTAAVCRSAPEFFLF